jgi:phage terminase large subunit-like protein
LPKTTWQSTEPKDLQRTLADFERWVEWLELTLDSGDPFVLEPFQREIARDVLECPPLQETWAMLPQGNAKALALDTPIPTPDGWTEMGELEVGDEVFDDRGCVCRVLLATETMLGHDCYRVVFSDGSSVVADADHLWRVRDVYRDERCVSLDVTKTTAEIATKHRINHPNGGRSHRYSVPQARPLELPEVLLPVEPYVLGAWLGDGESAGGRITFGDEFIREEIERRGYAVAEGNNCHGTRAVTASVYGLKTNLRQLGVLGNKHIPPIYLRASFLQRLNLLQGLMDTDGTISKPQGQCSLTTISMRLAADVLELVRSLGLKATVSERRAKFDGRDCGAAWIIQFHAYDDLPVFQMPRKYERQRPRPSRRSVSKTRRITEVVPVPSVPVRCIQVDSPSHLYLAGQGMVATHNTTLMAPVSLFLLDITPSAWIPVGAATRDQAEILFEQAAGFVERSGRAGHRFKIHPGLRRIKSKRHGGVGIKVYAADVKGGDGVIPTDAFVDELHRHDDLKLYRLWKGKLKKRGGRIVTISTAGEPGSPFEDLRETIRNQADERQREGCHLRAAGRGIVYHEWAVPSVDQARDLDVVKQANPLRQIDTEYLGDFLESLTLDFGEDWLRLTCNIPARSSFAAVPEAEWDRLETHERIPAGLPIRVGVDFGFVSDNTAIVPLWVKTESERMFGDATILKPPGGGVMLDVDDVKNAFRTIHERNPIEMAVCDTNAAKDLAQWLEDELGCTVIDRSQKNELQYLDYETFMRCIRERTIRHTGDREFRRHVLNAVTKRGEGDRKRFDRPQQSRNAKFQDRRVIDALVAAAMVLTTSMDDQTDSVYEQRGMVAA